MAEELQWFTIWIPAEGGATPHAYGVNLPDDRALVWTLGDGQMSEIKQSEARKIAARMHGEVYPNSWEDFSSEWRAHLSMQYVGWLSGQLGSSETVEPQPEHEPDYYDMALHAESLTPVYTDPGGSVGLVGRMSEGARGWVGKLRRPPS